MARLGWARGWLIVLVWSIAGCASGPEADDPAWVVLNDPPAIHFMNGGWQRSESTNPLFLTPDNMANAMIWVSRIKPGEELLSGGPVVTQSLDLTDIDQLLRIRLNGRRNLLIESTKIAKVELIHAVYNEDEMLAEEFAFEMEGYLIHIYLAALPGGYYDSGVGVVQQILETIEMR